MAKTTHFPAGVPTPSRRQMHRALREALVVLIDRFNKQRDPEGYARAEALLVEVFEHSAEDGIFASWVTRDLGKKKADLLRARYDAWRNAEAGRV